MILVWGPSDDAPVDRVLEELRDRSADVVHLEGERLNELRYDMVQAAASTGWIELEGCQVPLDRITAMYLRPGETATDRAGAAAVRVLLAVAASASTIVVNRPAAGRSNGSKPFQLRVIAAAGLAVPDTLVTTDPAMARAFLVCHGRLVYKSISGVRSIVATLTANDAERLDGVRTGPVQLQRWIDGVDVRVHVVGNRWFATTVVSQAADYRYAPLVGAEVAMAPCEIPTELGERLVALTGQMGLLVSGADLRKTPEDDWVCFEVNPSPGFTFYEDSTGQPIAAAIADLLTGAMPAI